MLYEEVGRRLERYFEIADVVRPTDVVNSSPTSSELNQ
jgi:hypothetical protein